MIENTTVQQQVATRDAIIRGQDIHNEVRQIVVDALKNGEMQPEHIKQVLQAVMNGAIEGSTVSAPEAAEELKQTLMGMDEALGQVAQASSLAIEEAAGNVDEFTEHDLKRAWRDLNDLESLFIETLSDVAKGGQKLTAQTLNNLIEHMQKNSTTVGRSITDASNHLERILTRQGKNIQLADAAKTTGASIARIASGLLAGIADSLSPEDKK